MAITIEMPKLSDTMSEGKILSWRKKEGDPVEAGEIIAEVESDKANMEIEAFDTGYVRKLLVAEGEGAPVGAPIALITEELDEDIEQALGELERAPKPKPQAATAKRTEEAPTPTSAPPRPSAPSAPSPAKTAQTAPKPPVVERVPVGRGAGKVLASPLAFRMAAELGLDLSLVKGTGPKGRIVKRDIEKAAEAGTARATSRPGSRAVALPDAAEPQIASSGAGPAAASAPFVPWVATPADAESEELPTSTMRRIIARRLTESKVNAPHFYASIDVDMKPAIAARESMNRVLGGGITFNDMIVKAVAIALMRHPAVNASWHEETIRRHKAAHVGVAVSIPDGLIVPVVRACHVKGLAQISREIKDLAERAQNKKLLPEEYQGGTFTVSNLGMFGISHFTGIINPPEACLLAVGAIRSAPVVEGDAVVPGKRMTMTLSCDHRVVDGALGAHFLKDLRDILENPASLAL